MKKWILMAISAVAAVAIFLAGTADVLTWPNLLVIVASVIWLSLVGYATYKTKEKKNEH